ncbi:hypothetical protein ABW19_dt0202963 [Dactylella cylindrospora]|nr:hypothetical protein ABW19_dt0202963 [Dactylella cylindrospora]
MTVSTATTLFTTLALSHMQKSARYPYRITCALIINIIVFTFLALSTIMFTGVSSGVYLAFLLMMVLGTAASAGFFQNGLFAYVGKFGPIYAQAVMAGQGVAGVLPSIAQMISVLAIPPKSSSDENTEEDDSTSGSSKSAFAYFLTATAVSGGALFLFSILLSRHKEAASHPATDELAESEAVEPKRGTSLLHLFKRLPLPAYTIFFTFALTMVFPVFTQATISVNPSSTSILSRPEVFIPLSFLIWNTGDLVGRVLCGFPKLTCTNTVILAVGASLRVVYLPLYYLCNIKGGGAKVDSDLFYWLVQITFGLTNGYIGSNAMMVAPTLVDEDEVGAAGGFMGLCLVAGLAVGSAASFLLNA